MLLCQSGAQICAYEIGGLTVLYALQKQPQTLFTLFLYLQNKHLFIIIITLLSLEDSSLSQILRLVNLSDTFHYYHEPFHRRWEGNIRQ